MRAVSVAREDLVKPVFDHFRKIVMLFNRNDRKMGQNGFSKG